MSDENYIILKDIKKWSELYESDKYLILYFTAEWCGPCRRVEPVLKSLNNKYKSIYMLKIDVDNEDTVDITYSMKISCMPTFIFMKDKKIIYSLEGANLEKLYELVNIFNESIQFNKEEKNIDNKIEDSSDEGNNIDINSSESNEYIE